MSRSLGLRIINLKRSILQKVAIRFFFRRISLTKVRHLKLLKLKKNCETFTRPEAYWKKLQIPLQSINSPEKRILMCFCVRNLEIYCRSKVLNHIQTALVLISYPGIFLGTFDVGLLRGFGNPHPVSGHNVKTDKYHTLESNTVKLMQF